VQSYELDSAQPTSSVIDTLRTYRTHAPGAWAYVQHYLEWVLGQVYTKSGRPRYIGRVASASPATGLMSSHMKQLKAFLDEALG